MRYYSDRHQERYVKLSRQIRWAVVMSGLWGVLGWLVALFLALGLVKN